jgi:hypothetical protein
MPTASRRGPRPIRSRPAPSTSTEQDRGLVRQPVPRLGLGPGQRRARQVPRLGHGLDRRGSHGERVFPHAQRQCRVRRGGTGHARGRQGGSPYSHLPKIIRTWPRVRSTSLSSVERTDATDPHPPPRCRYDRALLPPGSRGGGGPTARRSCARRERSPRYRRRRRRRRRRPLAAQDRDHAVNGLRPRGHHRAQRGPARSRAVRRIRAARGHRGPPADSTSPTRRSMSKPGVPGASKRSSR